MGTKRPPAARSLLHCVVDRVPPELLLGRNKEAVAAERLHEDDETILSADAVEYSDDTSTTASSLSDGDNNNRTSWQEKWQTLQATFSDRDRMLQRMSRAKSTALMKVIQSRELQVRHEETERLFWQHFLAVDDAKGSRDDDNSSSSSSCGEEKPILIVEEETEIDDDDSSDGDVVAFWHDARDTPDPAVEDAVESSSNDISVDGAMHRIIYNSIMMEWHTTIPAIISFGLYCLVHVSIYDVIDIVAYECRKYVTDTWVELGTFLLGLFMLRSSGYLYWWLNDVDFQCIKVDYHNRLRLRHWDACYLLWIKRRPGLRAGMFILGYDLCYKVIYHAYDAAYAFVFRPGGVDGATTGSRFDAFWSDWVAPSYLFDVDPTSLVNLATALFCATVGILSTLLLRRYGFYVFEKY